MNKKILLVIIAIVAVGIIGIFTLNSIQEVKMQEIEIGGLNFILPADLVAGPRTTGDAEIHFVSQDGTLSFIINTMFDPNLDESSQKIYQKIMEKGTNKTINGIEGIFFSPTSEDGAIYGFNYFYYKYHDRYILYCLQWGYEGDPIEFFSKVKINNSTN